MLTVSGRHHTESTDAPNIAWVRRTIALIRQKHPSGGVLPNFACGDEGAEEMYGSEGAERLRVTKGDYDGGDLFRRGARLDG